MNLAEFKKLNLIDLCINVIAGNNIENVTGMGITEYYSVIVNGKKLELTGENLKNIMADGRNVVEDRLGLRTEFFIFDQVKEAYILFQIDSVDLELSRIAEVVSLCVSHALEVSNGGSEIEDIVILENDAGYRLDNESFLSLLNGMKATTLTKMTEHGHSITQLVITEEGNERSLTLSVGARALLVALQGDVTDHVSWFDNYGVFIGAGVDSLTMKFKDPVNLRMFIEMVYATAGIVSGDSRVKYKVSYVGSKTYPSKILISGVSSDDCKLVNIIDTGLSSSVKTMSDNYVPNATGPFKVEFYYNPLELDFYKKLYPKLRLNINK